MTSDEDLSAKDAEDVRLHHLAALCLGLICVCAGVPIWWKTTEVHRVSLPYADIKELAEAPITYTTHIEVIWASSTAVDESFLTNLSVFLRQKLSKETTAPLNSLFTVEIRKASEHELQELDKHGDLPSLEPSIHSRYRLVVSNSALQGKPVLSHRNTLLMGYTGAEASELAAEMCLWVRNIMREDDVLTTYLAARGVKRGRPDKKLVRAYRLHPGYDVTFTLMVPEPERVRATWDIQQAVDDYLKPLQQSFDGLMNITISSQILYFIGIGRKPQKGEGFYYYQEKDLPHIINPLESKLGSHASSNPGMNFIVYIPTVNRSPLYIHDNQGSKVSTNAFLSPRWGGVLIYNPEDQGAKNESKGQGSQLEVDMHRVMQVFVQQIRMLLNLQPQLPADISSTPTDSAAPSTWEMSGWLRMRAVENLATCTATLQSLAHLLGQISNIVIHEEIGREVERSVACIRASKKLLHFGDLSEAFSLSRDAVSHAEAAFFHPSLLELLYFPEDQKFAIYIPLFLPIGFPILTSLYQAVKYFTRKNKQKDD